MGELVILEEYRAQKAAEEAKELQDLFERVRALRVSIYPEDLENEMLGYLTLNPVDCSFSYDMLNYNCLYGITSYEDLLFPFQEQEKNERRENIAKRPTRDFEPDGA